MKNSAVYLIEKTQIIQHFVQMVLFSHFGVVSVCRQTPSCSQYTIQQIQQHGTMLGLWRGTHRIIRCWSLPH